MITNSEALKAIKDIKEKLPETIAPNSIHLQPVSFGGELDRVVIQYWDGKNLEALGTHRQKDLPEDIDISGYKKMIVDSLYNSIKEKRDAMNDLMIEIDSRFKEE